MEHNTAKDIAGGIAEPLFPVKREHRCGTNEKSKISELEVSKLEGICAYFPLADCHNLKIFVKKKQINSNSPRYKEIMKNEIRNRLLMALLLYDHVFMHCSDPLRNEIVFETLSDCVGFIDDGSIMFVFSNKIVDISSDYQAYIRNKITEYSENNFSDIDISSLNQKHMTDDYYEKVIELLNHTPIMLKKGEEGRLGFKKLIQKDLFPGQEIAIIGNDNRYSFSHMRLLSLSLYQLLHLNYYKNDKIMGVFDEGKIEEFLKEWNESCRQGDAPFSRHTIVEQLRKECVDQRATKRKPMQTDVLDAIETRLSILYSRLNCGSHHIIDFDPAEKKRSVHRIDCFNRYIKKIAGRRENVRLISEKVEEIRNDKEWKDFRYEFFACMSELSMLTDVFQSREFDNIEQVLDVILQKHFPEDNTRYSSIKRILNN